MTEQNTRKLTNLMALLVFAVFALCVLLVTLAGADAYQRLTRQGQDQYARRTATQYITTRVRQSQGVALEDFSGVEALVFPETVENRVYVTRVYCYDGYLRELFTPIDGNFSPSDGEKLMPLQDLTLSLEGDLLRVRLTLPDGSVKDLSLHIFIGEGAES